MLGSGGVTVSASSIDDLRRLPSVKSTDARSPAPGRGLHPLGRLEGALRLALSAVLVCAAGAETSAGKPPGEAGQAAPCASGRLPCGGACIDPATDVESCGGCGIRCDAGMSCAGGQCVHRAALGAHTLRADVAGRGTNPMTTAPIRTQVSGSTFVLFVGAGIVGETAFASIHDNMGNRYVQIGATQRYASDQGELRAFICSHCRGGEGHTFSLDKTPALSNWEAVLFAIEVTGSPILDSYAQADARAAPLSAGSVATTRAGEVLLLCALAASYGSPDRYVPSADFTLLDEQTNGSDSLGGADAWALAGPPGRYRGALSSSLASSGAVFLVALAP